ncbi:hypothetical protein [Streptomyces flaveolus]|uniref:hypothetical protein n=1 Tax=Streptomyces flaveolus TaxID=67297 RepID=UPI003F4B5822
MAGSRTGAGGRGTGRAGGLRRCGEWCARHGVIVVVAWLVALIALQFADRSFGGDYSDNFTLPSSQSQQAVMTLLGRHAWWTPRWLDRILPHIDAEGEHARNLSARAGAKE